MSISLTPDLNRLVQEKLATGVYRSEEEVLQAALAALDVQEQTVAAIGEGYADYQAGRIRSCEEADSSVSRYGDS